MEFESALRTNGCPVYVMIKPTPPGRTQAVACRYAHNLDDSYQPERFHSTLLRLGKECDRSAAEWLAIQNRLADFAMGPFDVAFDVLDGMLLRGAAGSTGAARFHRALVRHLTAVHIGIASQSFRLHMSLAYRGPCCPRAAIAPIAWRAEQFLLVRSVAASIHAPGRHEIMGSWRLADHQLAFAL